MSVRLPTYVLVCNCVFVCSFLRFCVCSCMCVISCVPMRLGFFSVCVCFSV